MMKTRAYVARIRWRCEAHPDLEIDTRHVGFEDWQTAALFANGIGGGAACGLVVTDGQCVLRLVNGAQVVLAADDVVVWRREAQLLQEGAVDEVAFTRLEEGPDGVPGPGNDAIAFAPERFGVDEEDGGRLDVKVHVDGERGTLRLVAVSGTDDSQANELARA